MVETENRMSRVTLTRSDWRRSIPAWLRGTAMVFLQRLMSLTLLIVVLAILVVPRLLKWHSAALA